MSVCIFFGHRECPGLDTERLRCAEEKLIREGVDTFYVGNNGRFDAAVRTNFHVLPKSSAKGYITSAIPSTVCD